MPVNEHAQSFLLASSDYGILISDRTMIEAFSGH